MTAPITFTGKNLEAALNKASVTTGIPVDALKYETLAGATGGYALIKVLGQAGKAAVVASGPLVESLSGDPSAPAAEARTERSDRGRGHDRGGERSERPSRERPERGGRDRGPSGDRGPSEDRGGRDRGPSGDRGGRDRGPSGDRGGRDRGPSGDRGGRDRSRSGGEHRRRDDELLPVPQDGPTAVYISAPAEAPIGPFGEKVKELLEGVLTRMGFGMTAVITEDDDEVIVDLQSGPYHEALIGRELELLEAIEHLVEKVATGHGALPEGAPRKKVHLDSQGYRAKADVDLAQASRHMADRAIAEQRTMKLGPLDPRARRVVHLTLRDLPGVVTKSEGEGVFRRVCIIPKAEGAREVISEAPELVADETPDEPAEGK